MYSLLEICVLRCTFWVFGARWCPETLKWAYLGNQLSVRDEPKNTFFRQRWPTNRAILYGPRTPWLKSCRLLGKKSHPLFRSDAQQNVMSHQLPRYHPAEWPSVMILRHVWTCLALSVRFCLYCKTALRSKNGKNEQSINCMSGPANWPPVPLWDREPCGCVRMATALIVVPGSRVCICYPGPGGRSAHWKIYEIKSAQKNNFNSSISRKNITCTSVNFF